MLPRQPLRFLLADDPGAGKTIMAGLLINLKTAVEPALYSQEPDSVGFPTAPRFTIRVRTHFPSIGCRHEGSG